MRALRLLAPLLCVASTAAAAQQAGVDSACTYSTCALSIWPAWDGLAVVRGTTESRVANLHFFLPRDITPALRGRDTTAMGADSAAAHARRALALRQTGAGFTDLGALTIGVAIVRALAAGRVSHRDQAVAAAGLGAIAISVPLQFAADGELSRAVWWHNLRYTRPPEGGSVALGPTLASQRRDSAATPAIDTTSLGRAHVRVWDNGSMRYLQARADLRLPDGSMRTVYNTGAGQDGWGGELRLPPGQYAVVLSRFPCGTDEYFLKTLITQPFVVTAGQLSGVTVTLNVRQLDVAPSTSNPSGGRCTR